MIEHINIEDLNKAINAFDSKIEEMYKQAFTQAGPPPPPVTQQPAGGPPMDPAMMQGGAPMDPAAMQGGAPMDPAMMQGGAPMDPAAMQGGAPMPPPPAEGQAGPAIGPELEKNLTALFGGVEQMAQVITSQQDQIQTMSTRLQQIEQMLDQQNKALESPAGFEGPAM